MSDAQHKQEGLPVDLMFFYYNSFRECVCVSNFYSCNFYQELTQCSHIAVKIWCAINLKWIHFFPIVTFDLTASLQEQIPPKNLIIPLKVQSWQIAKEQSL